ncbi:GNAT family N-acetyltransferase [Streptomyces sp. NPDC047046]|uniref:GNAT family N-acetyltransferase n=1 Tax=Streptomyces sp. NPDC047046 TaxID=3155378 RepID=UPI0033CA7FFC
MSTIHRTATEADEPALRALWAEVFGPAPVAALWALGEERHARTLVTTEAGRLVAALHYQPRPVRTAPAGAAARVACLGGVATLPEARGRGHVRRMLDLAVSRMTEDGCAWSLLFTGTPRVYEGAGWTTYEAPAREGPLTAPPRAPGGVRAATAADLPDLARLRTAYDTVRPLTTVRTPADWHHRVPAWYPPATTTTLLTTDATGYLTFRHHTSPGTATIEELALADPADTPTLTRLLTATAHEARRTGHHHARTHLPTTLTPSLPTLLTTPHPAPRHTGMTRPLTATPAEIAATVGARGAVHWYGDSF